TAHFGYWEGFNTLSAHHELFTELHAIARARGYHKIIGPINFNTYHNYRLRTSSSLGFSSFNGEPIHPDYYPSLLEAVGYRLVQKYFSHYVPPQEVESVYARQQLYMDSLS
ncbi:MAG: hypothetical protein LPK45_08405, partial [Bacteroidota bacterium]|nr:hypothetical protein [Bacteroidota bacterium]MDX5431091.1 hypothetical protein [Bacteroidota bacterium]MDX5469843.1 hypothetical protein [Bacteroidota bacterium]